MQQSPVFFPDVLDTLIAMGKLLIALACGAVVGWEREIHEKAAGLRTHMLVSAGACLFAMLGLEFEQTGRPGDFLRVAQGIMMGIGFLAGGVIFKEGPLVRGLTTAAGLWVIAAIGLSVGMGDFALAFVATLLCFVTISVLGRAERRAKLHQAGGPEHRGREEAGRR
ncbi:MAG: MgtC/SapB family protein [Candidatus Eisenbacteria bacterium]|nr:MgtC/SapB family protein [Candidatus Eisenbacteria bacterium]